MKSVGVISSPIQILVSNVAVFLLFFFLVCSTCDLQERSWHAVHVGPHMRVNVINKGYHFGKISVTYIDITQFLIKLVGYFPYFMNQSIRLGTSWYSVCHEFF
jgi:hypothetical protein